jgi:hypothetical protein
VQEGTTNTSATSLTLIGKNVTTYGEAIAENTVYQLENFANTVPPGNPITGQIWWDIASATMKVYNGSTWVNTSAVYTGETAPVGGIKTGDLWFQPSTLRLRAFASFGGSTTWFTVNNVTTSASVPLVTPAGTLYFNTADQKLYISNGSTWVSTSNIATLSPGPYITGTAFNGTTNVEWTIAASSGNSANTIVARDSQGNFAAGNVTAELIGNASGSAETVRGVVQPANGGTGASSYSANEILMANATGQLAKATIQSQSPITIEYVSSGAVIKYTGISSITAGTGISVNVANGVAVISNVQSSGFLPGMIMIWTGNTAPAGWALCDGSNGTPDLSDRFVVGFGPVIPYGDTGGSTDAVVVQHAHSVTGSTASAGAHVHGGVPRLITDVDRGSGSSFFSLDNTGSTASAGTHTHNITGTATATGVSGNFANMPPYYALAYIMKL